MRPHGGRITGQTSSSDGIVIERCLTADVSLSRSSAEPYQALMLVSQHQATSPKSATEALRASPAPKTQRTLTPLAPRCIRPTFPWDGDIRPERPLANHEHEQTTPHMHRMRVPAAS